MRNRRALLAGTAIAMTVIAVVHSPVAIGRASGLAYAGRTSDHLPLLLILSSDRRFLRVKLRARYDCEGFRAGPRSTPEDLHDSRTSARISVARDGTFARTYSVYSEGGDGDYTTERFDIHGRFVGSGRAVGTWHVLARFYNGEAMGFDGSCDSRTITWSARRLRRG